MSLNTPSIKPEFNEFKELKRYGINQLQTWIDSGINKECVEFTEKFGYCLSNYRIGFNKKGDPIVKALSTSQIRNIFGELKRIEMKLDLKPDNWSSISSELLLVKPKMAYAAKRDKTTPAEFLYEIISKSLDIIYKGHNDTDSLRRFTNFMSIFEAILAYHKAFEKR